MSKRKIENSGTGDEALYRAANALRRGEVVVFPTETFYGLGADALDPVAVEKVASLKGRGPASPIAVIVADKRMLRDVVAEIPPMAQRLMARFWPGPLTLVLPAKKGLPAPLLNRDGGVGVRISSHPVAIHLARALGRPITATSANPSGKEPARTIEEARTYFCGRIEIFLNWGRLQGKKGSTVVEVCGDKMTIIREGEISSRDLEKALSA